MNLKPRTRAGAEIPRLPLVAMIDVVLFILLYFIMAGNLAPVEQNLETALRTDTRSSARSEDLLPQVLTVEMRGESVVYAVGPRAVSDRSALVELLGRLPKRAGVAVRVSGAVPVWAAAGAVQACKDAGFLRVSYVPRAE